MRFSIAASAAMSNHDSDTFTHAVPIRPPPTELTSPRDHPPRVIARIARKHTGRTRDGRKTTRISGVGSRAGIAVALSRRVTVWTAPAVSTPPCAAQEVEIHRPLSVKRRIHVESIETRNRHAGRADRQCGVRHERAGADAHLPLEEGRTIPGSRMRNSTA